MVYIFVIWCMRYPMMSRKIIKKEYFLQWIIGFKVFLSSYSILWSRSWHHELLITCLDVTSSSNVASLGGDILFTNVMCLLLRVTHISDTMLDIRKIIIIILPSGYTNIYIRFKGKNAFFISILTARKYF